MALISSGFLRNYRLFLGSDLFRRLVREFDSHLYISAWNEDGYGSNSTHDYSRGIISEEQIRGDFGGRLRFLHRESFQDARPLFRYHPVMPLLSSEPQVLEKYRSKFHMVKRVDVPYGYDAYFHFRFDMDPYPEISEAILDCLHGFVGESGVAYTASDIFGRSECFGDVFQVFDHETFLFFQGFERRLYQSDYLSLDIPNVPERILHHYFSAEMPKVEIRQIPLEVRLNRNIFHL